MVDPVSDADKLVKAIGLAARNDVLDAVALSIDEQRERERHRVPILGMLTDEGSENEQRLH